MKKNILCLSYSSGVIGVFPFCNEADRLGCTVDRLSIARCNLVTPAPSAIDLQFQVWLPCLKTHYSQLTRLITK